MNTRRVQTKTEQIANHLREQIISGHFGEGQLPSKLDLASHFGVSHRTIEMVLKRLRDEGLIRGIRGMGIFVNTEVEKVSNITPRLVLTLLPQCSIFESEPYNQLRLEAFSRGILPVNLPMPDRYQKLSLQEKALLTQILKAPIRGVLYNGRGYRAEPFLDNWRNLKSVALLRFDSENDPPGSSLLIDYEAGAEKAARHFIEQGCKKLLVLGGFLAPDVPKTAAYWKKHITTNFLNGAAKAAREAGLPPPDLYFIRQAPRPLELFQSVWSEELAGVIRKYDGILSTTDMLSYAVIRQAQQMGIRVPEDLLVSGESNTAWCREFGLDITTISGMTETICSKAFDILEAGGIHHEKIIPDLIIRKSSIRQ